MPLRSNPVRGTLLLLAGTAALLLAARAGGLSACPGVDLLRAADSDPSAPFEHQLTVCSLVHEEARHLPEWIEFHRLQGADHFVVFDDGSASPARNLERYVAEGLVELHNAALEPACASHPEDPTFYKLFDCQRALFQRCIDGHARRTRWLAVFDVDEFLFAPKRGASATDNASVAPAAEQPTLLRVLDAHPHASGFRFRGAVFGTSGLEREPGDAPGLAVPLLTPLLTHRQALADVPPQMTPFFWAHKEIANPRMVTASSVHWFEYKRCARVVDFDIAADSEGGPQAALMFHLQYRSRETAARKAKLNLNQEVSYHTERDALYNAVLDERAAAYAPELTAALRERFPAPAAG